MDGPVHGTQHDPAGSAVAPPAAVAAERRPLAHRLGSLVVAGLLLATGACDGSAAPPSEGPDRVPPAVAGPAGPPPHAQVDPPVEGAPLAGTWWALSPQAPYLAFRLDLEPAAAEGRYGGRAVVFDWRDTIDGLELSRPSRPVDVQGHWDAGAGQGEVSGPMPMVDADGRPNGHRGQWRLANLEPLPGSDGWRLGGRLHHTEFTGQAGLPVELERAFRPWRQDP